MNKVFFTLGGAEAIENAIKFARHYTGKHKLLARYRSYHGATLGAMTLTGDPRRWANEPGIVGVVRYPDTHRWGEAEPRPVAESLQGLEDVIRYEGAQTIAAIFLETIVGTNGILIPPDGYIAGVREHLRPVRHPDGRRRGHGRLRADRQVVRRRSLGRHAGPDDDGQGAHQSRTSRSVRVAMRDSHRRGLRIEDVLRRSDVQPPSREPGGSPGHHPGLRGGRAHRERGPSRAGHALPSRSASRRSIRPSVRTGTSDCSGSSIWSEARTRGRR